MHLFCHRVHSGLLGFAQAPRIRRDHKGTLGFTQARTEDSRFILLRVGSLSAPSGRRVHSGSLVFKRARIGVAGFSAFFTYVNEHGDPYALRS